MYLSFFLCVFLASTPPTSMPASTMENGKDWIDTNANNTIVNGQFNTNSIHVSEKSMLIIFFLLCNPRFFVLKLRTWNEKWNEFEIEFDIFTSFDFHLYSSEISIFKSQWYWQIRAEVDWQEAKLADGCWKLCW